MSPVRSRCPPLHLTAHVCEVRLTRLWRRRPRASLAPVSAQHQAADAVALDGVELCDQPPIERQIGISEKRYPAFSSRLLVYLGWFATSPSSSDQYWRGRAACGFHLFTDHRIAVGKTARLTV